MILIILLMTVELADRQVRRDADSSFERSERDLGLLRQRIFGNVFRDVWSDSRQRLRIPLSGVQHVFCASLTWQSDRTLAALLLLGEGTLDVATHERFVVLMLSDAVHGVRVGEKFQRIDVRHACHRHEISGSRIVAERQERERSFAVSTRGDQCGERRPCEAVEIARRHVTAAWRMVIDRVVQAVQNEQFLRVFREEVFVAHPFRNVFGGRRKIDGAVRQDLVVLVEPIDLVDPLWIHQVRRVPSAGRVAHDVVRAVVDGQVFAIVRR